MDTQDVKGKRVLVSGSGTGLGRGVALEFSKAGADVALHYSHSAAGAEAAVEEITKAGGKAKAFQADFSKVEEVQKLGKDAVEFLGGIDILVNNAGITFNREFEKVTQEQYDRVYSVNIKGMFFLSQSVVPAMQKQGKGVIVNISSNHAFTGYRDHAVYAGTKGAIVAFTRTLSTELAPMGIRVCCLAPGWIRVENQEKVLGDNFDWEKGGQVLPAGFAATPSDLGKLVIALATEPGKYIFGETLVADGGELAIMPLTGSFKDPVDEKYGQGYVPGL